MTETNKFNDFATERPNYFPGQFLLEDDFELQHKYLADRLRYQNRSLHVSGIIDGLEVEFIENKKKFQIKSGSAINSNGDLIVLKENTFFPKSDLNSDPFLAGEFYIYISYGQQKKEEKQQENIEESFTRWQEDPTIGFADKTPNDGVSVILAKIVISSNNVPDLDSNVRSYSGIFLPNATGNDLTLRLGGMINQI